MTDAERRETARQFYNKWVGRGKEDEDDRSYWLDILGRILGVENVTDHIDFQKKVIVDGHTKKIDAYIPETRVLIEQKSLGIGLDKKGHQSGGIELTPYEQAKRYNNNLPYDEKARWIVTSNFAEIWIYDMNMRVPEPVKITLADLQSKYSMLDFLINHEQTQVTREMEVSVKAGELVGLIYDALYKQYINPESERALKSLNALCVRLVFCLYAEDAGVFGSNHRMFHDYLVKYEASDIRKALIELFKILDTKPADRDPYDTSDLSEFPYVNGGLFADENIEIPHFTDEIKNILLSSASNDFDWSAISPTIFGAVFESTLNPETRRSGGMHYTSIENIHKVIDPLFLDELKQELDDIKKISVTRTRDNKLKAFQTKLAGLKWLDPACGSGNFLTETYISIRRLENEVLKELQRGQIVFGEAINPIQVSISQFYGIEINDFAVTVAKTALWIAESQMMKETEDVVHMNLDFLPLKTNAYIVEGNALRMDWNDVVHSEKLNYIMGNPPFVGQTQKTREQSIDMATIFGSGSPETKLDYVICWYKKAMRYIKNTTIKVAFVSTNSICQGESVPTFWRNMIEDGAEIQFAHNHFKWTSESTKAAAVYCIIVGFSNTTISKKKLYNGKSVKICEHINAYLFDGPDVWLESRGKPQSDMPKLQKGSEPSDGGNLFLTKQEKDELVRKYPTIEKYIKPFIGASEFLNLKNGEFNRYCFWFAEEYNPTELRGIKEIESRFWAIKEKRSSSSADRIRKMADKPYLFSQIRQPKSTYIVIPETTTSNRRYIPMGFFNPNIIAGNSTLIAPDLSLYHFGILISNVHMAWMRTVCGRMGMGYRYSPAVYNNFPWPTPTNEQKARIIQTAQDILIARSLFPNSSLVDLYDPLIMPLELQNAHNANNKAVMKAYGFSVRDMSEEDCVVELMKMYEKLAD